MKRLPHRGGNRSRRRSSGHSPGPQVVHHWHRNPGAMVAAVGASKGTVRDLDDRAIARADTLALEWKPQAPQEAGDLLLCQPGAFSCERGWQLDQIVDGSSPSARRESALVIYKTIGVGVEDSTPSGRVSRRACEPFRRQAKHTAEAVAATEIAALAAAMLSV